MLAVVALSYEEEAEITQEVIQYVFSAFTLILFIPSLEMLLLIMSFSGTKKRFSRS